MAEHDDDTLLSDTPDSTATPHPDASDSPPASLPPELADSEISMRQRLALRTLHSSGGIGEVWRAYDRVLGREIALKRLRPEQGEHLKNRERFTREAKITGQLEHPGVVPVYDFGTAADGVHCYYTMRFVRGATLREVIADYHAQRADSPHSPGGPALLRLLRQFVDICNTIAFAHSRGVIHRDIKSENIIAGEFGELVVLDWGLAKRLQDAEPDGTDEVDKRSPSAATDDALSASLTQYGERLGTPVYMAPEQALGMIQLIDQRTDIYALAGLLYEILTGRPPFEDGPVAAIFDAVINHTPVMPRKLAAGVPEELERICLKGLAKDRAARQQSVTELASEIETWMAALTERKLVEQERERFFDLSTDLLALMDKNGVLMQSNRSWSSLLGWGSGALKQASFWSFVMRQDRQEGLAKLTPSRQGIVGKGCELRMRVAGGGYRWIDWRVQSSLEGSGLYLVGRDITERKQAEQESDGLLESAPDATCVIDETGQIVRVNAQLLRMYGYSRQELLGQDVEILVPEKLRQRHVGHVSRFLQNPSPRPMGNDLRLSGQKADGSLFAVEISLSPVVTERGLLVSCSLRDVSERRKTERRVLGILNAAPDAMLVIDTSEVICHTNPLMDQLFGYAPGQLLGQPLELLIPSRFRSAHKSHVATYKAAPTPRSMGRGQVLFGRHKDGSELQIQISLNSVETEDEMLIACAVRRSGT